MKTLRVILNTILILTVCHLQSRAQIVTEFANTGLGFTTRTSVTSPAPTAARLADLDGDGDLDADYTVTIHGTSNLHDWEEKVGIVSGNCGVTWNVDGSFDLDAMTMKMNVHSI